MSITITFSIKTNLPPRTTGDYWIRLRRNNEYKPYRPNSESSTDSDTLNMSNQLFETNNSDDNDNWTTVCSRKKKAPIEQPIYYWVVESHNLFDRRNKSYKLYFIDPNLDQITNMDNTSYMAIDNNDELKTVHVQLKHRNMKMNPTFFIARRIDQIKNALQHVKYCVVKVENNEQKLVDEQLL